MNEQHRNPRPDIEIAQAAKMQPIVDVAAGKLGIGPANLELYGHYKAKISLPFLQTLKD
jgi:formate--tetrahydrofolate ligase